jgi:hypothetical protein
MPVGPSDAALLKAEPHLGINRLLRHPQPRMVLALALNLMPALAAFLFITAFGVNVPFWDDFQIIPYIAAQQSRTLTFESLFALHNENRILFPRLVMLATAQVTHFNLKAEMYLYWFCLCLICCLVLIAFTQVHGLTHRSVLLFAPFTFLLFSLRQWENLLWGWEICWGMAAFFLVFALYLLQVRSHATLCLLLAIAGGAIASFSLLSGLLVWPVGLFEIVYLSRARTDRHFWLQRSALWLAAGAAVFAIYFHGFARASYVPPTPSVFQHPFEEIQYFLAAVGAPLSVEWRTAVVFGALLCMLILSIFRQMDEPRSERPLDVSLAVATLGFLSAGVLTVGRSGYGVDQALSSRYTIFGLIGIGALYLFFLTHFGWRQPFEALAKTVMLSLLAIGIAVGYGTGLPAGRDLLSLRLAQATFVRSYATRPYTTLAGLTPGDPITFTVPQLVYMDREGLSLFHDSKARSSQNAGAMPAITANPGAPAAFGGHQVNETPLPPYIASGVVGAATRATLCRAVLWYFLPVRSMRLRNNRSLPDGVVESTDAQKRWDILNG